MASFREIKRRIGGVQNIQQITRAMKMVAAARLRRSEEAILSLRPYASRMAALCARFLREAVGTENPLFEEREVESVGLLVIASDRGLCGAYNNRIVDRAVAEIKQRAGQEEPVLCVVGERAIRGVQRAGYQVHAGYTDVFNPVHYDVAQTVRRELEQLFLQRRVDEVIVVYTEFFNPMRQQVLTRRLFPCPPREHWEQMQEQLRRRTPAGVHADVGEMERAESKTYIYEPDYDSICDELLEHNVDMQVYRALLEAQASEHGARMMAMDNATDNAEEMIDDLTLQMNRLRQESITREILDVVGGAEAMKE
ncbi:MAG: ATP synthase F1 subunit gamma [Planctomycetota bacterium]